MSTSRAKQRCKGTACKTKSNGTKYAWARNQKMTTQPRWMEKLASMKTSSKKYKKKMK